jgi:FtsH-binding integral membrane protein
MLRLLARSSNTIIRTQKFQNSISSSVFKQLPRTIITQSVYIYKEPKHVPKRDQNPFFKNKNSLVTLKNSSVVNMTLADDKNKNDTLNAYSDNTYENIVKDDVVLQQYLRTIATTSAKALVTSGVAATAGVFICSAAPTLVLPIMLGSFVTTIAAAFTIGKGLDISINPVERSITETNTTARLAAANVIFVGVGLSMGPILTMALEIFPAAIPLAACLTAGTAAGMLHFANRKKEGSLSKFGPALYVGLWSLAGVNLGMLGYSLLFGHGQGIELLFGIENYVGIVLFSALTAYDYQQCINDYKKLHLDTLGTATNFHLNMINMFIRYLHILLKAKK